MESEFKIGYNCEFWTKHWRPCKRKKGLGVCCFAKINKEDCVDKHYKCTCDSWQIRSLNKLD